LSKETNFEALRLGGQLTGAKELDMTGGRQALICSEQT